MRIKQLILIILLLPILNLQAKEIEVKDMNTQYFNINNVSSINDFRISKFNEALQDHENKKPDNWNLLVDKVKQQTSDYDKLAIANLLINQIPYLDNTDGSYMSPYVALNRGGIVCKDYAIIKYILLKDAGFNTDNMLFMVHDSLTSPDTGQAHVVLSVKIDKQIYIANQYIKSIADKYNRDNYIQVSEFKNRIKSKGVNALRIDFKIDSYYTKHSLFKIQNYQFNERKLFSLMNENGNYKLTINIKKNGRKYGV